MLFVCVDSNIFFIYFSLVVFYILTTHTAGYSHVFLVVFIKPSFCAAVESITPSINAFLGIMAGIFRKFFSSEGGDTE
jgi:hypothetical protein